MNDLRYVKAVYEKHKTVPDDDPLGYTYAIDAAELVPNLVKELEELRERVGAMRNKMRQMKEVLVDICQCTSEASVHGYICKACKVRL